MVQWGYCTICRIKTNVPSNLEVSVKKSPDFQKLLEAYEVVRAEKTEAFKAKKEAEAALKKEAEAARKLDADDSTEQPNAEKVALTAVEAVIEA